MKRTLKMFPVFLLSAGFSISCLRAQTPVTPTPPPPAGEPVLAGGGPPAPGGPLDQPIPPGPGRRGPGGKRPGLANDALRPLTTLNGTVQQFTGNDDFVFDGFMLNAGTAGVTTVKFPPHLGQQIQKTIKVGSTISVTGISEISPRGGSEFRMNSLTAGKTTVVDAPPTPPVTPPVETLTTASGKIIDYRFDREGRINGFVLDDRTIVRVPGHVAYQLADLATKGMSITVQGFPRTFRDGQVQIEKVNILRASVLTINGQQYLVR